MKSIFSLLLLLFAFYLSYAQKTISGKVLNEDGEAVPSASVTIEETGKDAIIAYGITNSQGEYKVSFTSTESNVDVKIKAFNHKPFTQSIRNENQNINFRIQTQATEIKEVELKTRLITKRGDTISYDLKSFEAKNDRSLADVLKRMPGIEVNKDGSILYQGQPLVKFYVNGKDLMEGGYGVVNNSLPKDAVQKVEVMENHQPIKILQDKVPSDQAAINIKLKKSVTMTGRGEVGAGIADPGLWNVKLTPMFFGQKNQWVVNYKTNNMGESVENEGNIFAMGNRWEGTRRSGTQNRWLGIENASVASIPEKRYLLNNVHYLSANILSTPFKNKEWELKANANYVNNAVERESYNETFDKEFSELSTRYRFNNFYSNRAKGEIVFSKNAKEGFFRNTTTFNQFWNTDRAISEINNPSQNLHKNSAQSLESPTTNFMNSLSTIIPWKTKMLNVMSFINYQKDNQELSVLPGNYLFSGLNFDEVRQKYSLNTFEANHSATMGFTKKFWTFTPEIGFKYLNNQLDSDLLGVSGGFASTLGSDYQNDLRFVKAVPYAGLGINYKSESWTVGIQMPANFYNIKAENESRNLHKEFSKTTFEPSGFIQYSFASFWKAMLTGGMSNSFSGIDDIYSGIIMTSPIGLSAMAPNNPVMETGSNRIGTRIEYRNPLNNLFFNLNYSRSSINRNLIANYVVDGSGFGFLTYFEQDNKTTSDSQSAEIGKYFPKLKSNMSVSFRNSQSVSDNYRNNLYYENKNSTQNFGFKLNNAYLSWLSADYNFTMGWGSNKNILSNTTNRSYNHNLGITLFPIENHSISLNWDQINSQQLGEKYRNAFYDLTYQFAWSKKKVDFELKWLNIANQKYFEILSDTFATTTYNKIRIRPSQVMFSVKFNFK